MKVSCPSCQAKYNIADDKVKGKKVKVRCKSCGTQILVDGNAPPTTSSLPPAEQAPEAANAVASDSPPSADVPEPEASDAWTVNFSDTDERSLTTTQIAEMAVQGELPDEVFVWKEGMEDWQSVTSVPELASAIAAAKERAASEKSPTTAENKPAIVAKATNDSIAPAATPELSAGPIVAAPGSALAKKMASAKTAAAQKKTAAAEALKQEPREEAAAQKGASASAESPAAPKAATKLAAKRQTGTHDLFAAVEKAGSEIDVVTEPEARETTTKATGARNENSVLFSLDALKSGMLGGAPAPAASSQPAPPGPGPRKKAPGPPAKRLEDLMAVDVGSGPTLGRGGGGLLLSGNDALLAAPPPPPPKPEPKPIPVASIAPSAAVAAAPPKGRVGLFVALAVILVSLGAGGAFLAMKSSTSQAGPEASASSAKAAESASALAAQSAAPAVSNAPTEVAKSDVPDAGAPVASAAAPSNAASQPVAVAKVGGGSVGKVVPGKSGGTETKPPDKKETKPEPAPASGGGSGSFNKDAAIAALSVAASQATVCKRPEGPWGSGRAVVTFASSGRVTTANVTGEPFGGTAVGGCVASVFRRAKIPPFSGDPVTVSKSFTIAP